MHFLHYFIRIELLFTYVMRPRYCRRIHTSKLAFPRMIAPAFLRSATTFASSMEVAFSKATEPKVVFSPNSGLVI